MFQRPVSGKKDAGGHHHAAPAYNFSEIQLLSSHWHCLPHFWHGGETEPSDRE